VQSQLQEISEDYTGFYNDAPVAYVTFDADSHILKANNALAELLGVSKKHLFKQPFTDFVLPCDQDVLYLYRQALLDNQKPTTCELRLRQKDGQSVWVKCAGFFKHAPTAHEINLVMTDISECKQTEQALQELLTHQEIVLEAERTRIEREIHAELGGRLNALNVDLEGLRKQLPAELSNCHEKCALMKGQMDEALQVAHNITLDLRPTILEQLGLLAAITWKIEALRQETGIHYDVILPEQPLALDKDRECAVFQIMREALTNITLHARASHVSVDMATDARQLVMTIADNGCGMSQAHRHAPAKYGITGMQERARQFTGNLTIDSTPGKGTTLVLSMPLKQFERG
jgi:PAS domain S-box-containing protein